MDFLVLKLLLYQKNYYICSIYIKQIKMEDQFVTYEQALSLNELGFKESCFGEWRQWGGGLPWLQLYQDIDECSTDDRDYQYTTEAIAPLKSQVFKFFRDKHNLQSNVSYGLIFSFIINNKSYEDFPNPEDNWFITFEEAESACIDKLIELIKNK